LWKGVGIGNFGGKYRQNKINAWIYSKYASNELLQTLVEKGIPGLITTLLLFSYIIFISLKGILTFAKNKDITDFAVSLSVLIFLIINLVDFPLRIFPIELCFFLFFSSLLAKKKLVVLPKKIFYLFFIPFFLVSTILFKDNLDLRSGKKAFAKGEFERSEKIFKTYIVGPKIIINPESLYWLAAIQVEKDQGELAIEYLNKAKMLDCFNEESDYEIAKIKYQKNELDEAAKILFSSIEKNYFLPPKYYWTYVKILLEKNRNNEALDLLKQAEKIYLSNPNLLNEKKSVLEETDFLSDLKEIYFLLFKLTNDKNYLVSLFSI